VTLRELTDNNENFKNGDYVACMDVNSKWYLGNIVDILDGQVVIEFSFKYEDFWEGQMNQRTFDWDEVTYVNQEMASTYDEVFNTMYAIPIEALTLMEREANNG